MIRRAEISDIGNIIELHLNSFSDSHFSVLFNRKMLLKYFRVLLEMNNQSYVCINETNSKLVGFIIAGFQTQEAVTGFIKKNKISLFLILLKNPKFLMEKAIEVYEKFFSSGFNVKAMCRLYLIATDTNFKGQGIGKKLIYHLEEQLLKQNINSYGLSVRRDNERAIKFYNNQGYKVQFENVKSIYYEKTINTQPNN